MALSSSIANHFPDNDLDWTLQVDASNVAVVAVMYQTHKRVYGSFFHELLVLLVRRLVK